MAGNRKAAEQTILEGIEEILPGGGNRELYEKAFAAMDDAQFEAFIEGLENNTQSLAIVSPNFDKTRLTVEHNLALAKKWGHEFFERLWIDPGNGLPRYLTPEKYLIIELPLRRQAQVLIDKISIPKNTTTIDDLTGQPAGESKGSKVSYPEIQILSSQNLVHSLEELIRFRGGDVDGFRAMNERIAQTGEVDLEDIQSEAGEVESTRTLSTILTAMHLSNTL